MGAPRATTRRIKLPVSLPPLRLPEGFLTRIGASLFSSFSDNAVQEFERQFSRRVEMSAFASPSARGGLFFILKALRSKEKNEVIVSAYNFPAIPAVIRAVGMIPVFVDIDPKTFNIDFDQIADTLSNRTAAVLVTHMYGLPCNMDGILSAVEGWYVPVIEDCAHALGATFRGRNVGTFGTAALYSFGLSKPLPCGGGGMVVIRDSRLAANLRHSLDELKKPGLKQQLFTGAKAAALSLATEPAAYPLLTRPLLSIARALGINLADKVFEEAGVSNAREPCFSLSSIQAALGMRYLPLLEMMTLQRVRNADMLSSLLGDNIAPYVPSISTHAYTQYAIRVAQREMFRRSLWRRGIFARSNYIKNCAEKKGVAQMAEIAEKEVVYLPLYARMTPVEIQSLAQAVLENIA